MLLDSPEFVGIAKNLRLDGGTTFPENPQAGLLWVLTQASGGSNPGLYTRIGEQWIGNNAGGISAVTAVEGCGVTTTTDNGVVTIDVDTDILALKSDLASLVTTSALASSLANYYTKSQIDSQRYYDVCFTNFGAVGPNAQVGLIQLQRPVTMAANFTGSGAKAKTAATAQTIFSVKKNGAEVGTITFEASGTTGILATTGGTDVSFAAGDVLEVVGPGTADTTLANVTITLVGLTS